MAESDASFSFSPLCAVCLRAFSLTAAGLIQTHGPVHNCCPGSRQPPSQQATPNPRLFDQGLRSCKHRADILDRLISINTLGPTSTLPLRSSVKVLKRSRELCASKLTAILNRVVSKNDHSSPTSPPHTSTLTPPPLTHASSFSAAAASGSRLGEVAGGP